MKKHYSIFILANLLFGSVFAQGPITSDNLFQVGDETTIAICGNDMVDAGPSGADQTWDMSGLTETEEQGFTFVDPEGTFWNEDFPMSTICGINWTGENSYYSHGVDGLTVEGYAGLVPGQDTDTFKLVYDDTEFFIPIPFEFGDQHSDDFSGTSYALGIEVPFTGGVEFEADGYGTLILPTGTYTDVVRYHFTREQINETGGFEITQTKEQWGWMSMSHRNWLMIQEINNDGFSESELIWYDKNPFSIITGIENPSEFPLTVFPNPASRNELINLQWDRTETVQFTLTSVAGKQMMDVQMNLIPGNNSIDLSGVEAAEGLYVIQVNSTRGTETSRLILSK